MTENAFAALQKLQLLSTLSYYFLNYLNNVYNAIKPKNTSSDCSFGSTRSPKTKYIQSTTDRQRKAANLKV